MKNKNKDRKPHESIIGKIIYGFLLFMPLLAIGVTCAYAIFNKNAYHSYYGETINESKNIYLENNSQLISNKNTLYMENNYFLGTERSGTITYQNVSLKSGNFANNTPENIAIILSSNRLYLYRGTSITFYDDNNNTSFLMSTINGVILEFVNIQSTPNSNIAPAFYYIQYNDNSFVSEVFYYSIDKVQESPLFNWAEDSAIYTGMTKTCNALNITTPFIPLLLTYWLIISVIYILYDIILVILHIFHKKIHQLEDSF